MDVELRYAWNNKVESVERGIDTVDIAGYKVKIENGKLVVLLPNWPNDIERQGNTLYITWIL